MLHRKTKQEDSTESAKVRNVGEIDVGLSSVCCEYH